MMRRLRNIEVEYYYGTLWTFLFFIIFLVGRAHSVLLRGFCQLSAQLCWGTMQSLDPTWDSYKQNKCSDPLSYFPIQIVFIGLGTIWATSSNS